MEAVLNLRQARMEFKTTLDMKELLSRAAALDGLDLTSFVLGPAVEKARKVLNEHSNIALSQRGQLALVQLLSPSQQLQASTQAMKDLMALPDFPERQNTFVMTSTTPSTAASPSDSTARPA